MSTPISRRVLLRAGGTGAIAALLAACTDSSTTADDTGGTTDAAGTTAPSGGASDTAGTAPLFVLRAFYEVVTGPDGRVPFGILDAEQRPLLDQQVVASIRSLPADGGEPEIIATDLQPVFYGEGLGDRGVYVLDTDLPEAGLYDVIVTLPGVGGGQLAIQAIDPADSIVYAPGSTFPSVATPTTAAPGELESLCTQQPPCSMHDVSLDEALAAGPVVLTIATPQFCQTAVCGPVVSVVEQVRDSLGRDDVTYVHAEVYTDAGITPAPVVDELGLPSEPWTWVIAADGTVTDRFDGPVVPDLLAASIEAL